MRRVLILLLIVKATSVSGQNSYLNSVQYLYEHYIPIPKNIQKIVTRFVDKDSAGLKTTVEKHFDRKGSLQLAIGFHNQELGLSTVVTIQYHYQQDRLSYLVRTDYYSDSDTTAVVASYRLYHYSSKSSRLPGYCIRTNQSPFVAQDTTRNLSIYRNRNDYRYDSQGNIIEINDRTFPLSKVTFTYNKRNWLEERNHYLEQRDTFILERKTKYTYSYYNSKRIKSINVTTYNASAKAAGELLFKLEFNRKQEIISHTRYERDQPVEYRQYEYWYY